MDETRIDYRRTLAGCLAVIVLLFLGALVGRCSAPAAAQETQPAPDPVVFLGNDNTIEAQAAIAELDAFLVSLTTTTTAVPQYRLTPTPSPSSDTSRWDQLAQCESGGRWDYPPVSGGFSGGTMTWIGTWKAQGGEEFAPEPWMATREQQIIVNERILASGGWGQWPGCSSKLGFR